MLFITSLVYPVQIKRRKILSNVWITTVGRLLNMQGVGPWRLNLSSTIVGQPRLFDLRMLKLRTLLYQTAWKNGLNF